MSFEDAVQELEQQKNQLAQAELQLVQSQTRRKFLDEKGSELQSQVDKASEEEERVVRETRDRKDKIDTINNAIKSKKDYLKYVRCTRLDSICAALKLFIILGFYVTKSLGSRLKSNPPNPSWNKSGRITKIV